MDVDRELRLIAGRHLRYLLVLILDRTRAEMTIPQLEHALAVAGFSVRGPRGKAVSDSLRWAAGHGHVKRTGHGRYITNGISKQTRHRFRTRVAALAAQLPAR